MAPSVPPASRSLAEQLQDIAARSPKDYAAIVVIVQAVRAALDARDAERSASKPARGAVLSR